MAAALPEPAPAFELQGHRGARGLWPENTLAGFERALALGVSAFELDCAVTQDGVIVISHDPQLNPDHTRDARGRFLDGPGPLIHALRCEQLLAYDVGRLRPGSDYARQFPQQQPVDGQRIPRLAELFELVGRLGARTLRFNLEVKTFPLQPALTMAPEPFALALLQELARAGMAARAIVQSFDWRVIRAVQRHAPQVATGALTDQQPGDDTVQFDGSGPSAWLGGLDARDFGASVPRLVLASGARNWSPGFRDIDAAAVREAHALGLTVIPWTVNAPADMDRLLAIGVDGLITDRPDLLRERLAAHGRALPEPLAR